MMQLAARYETGRRYYEVWTGKDLFGQKMIEERWGGKFNRLGNNHKTLVTEPELHAMLAKIAETRRKHKYERVH